MLFIPASTKYGLMLLLSVVIVASWLRADPPSVMPARREATLPSHTPTAIGQWPLRFEMNEGQTDTQVKFLTRGNGYQLFLTATEAVWSLGEVAPAVLRMQLIKSNPAPHLQGQDQLPGQSNYFTGNDHARWRSGIPNFAKVRYREVYPGIDLVYYGQQQQLEYDFVLAPGADPASIKIQFRGAHCLQLTSAGELIAQTAAGELHHRKPRIYQMRDGKPREIPGGYQLNEAGEIGFEVGAYDLNETLVIDPILSYSTYLGGSDIDESADVAVDANGNVYLTGRTISPNFPTTTPLQPARTGSYDIFVTKFNPAGSTLVYSTYLGGNSSDFGRSIVVDTTGNVYVTGGTDSNNFPTANPVQPAFRGGTNLFGNPGGDAVVLKLNSAGSALVYSTYLGGADNDFGFGIAVDDTGNAYVTGRTDSTNFPTARPFQADFKGGARPGGDAFVTKLNPAGSALVYSTYLGGQQSENGYSIAVDSSGNAYVTGVSFSPDFPTVNPIQSTCRCAVGFISVGDAFIVKFNSSGSALVYSTYLGGGLGEFGNAIAVDAAGNAYVAGDTSSRDFPTTAGSFQTTDPDLDPATNVNALDGFVTKLDATGTKLLYSTYLGGNAVDFGGSGLAIDRVGNAFVTGATLSSRFPTVNSFQATYGGGTRNGDAFIAMLNPAGTTLLFASYLGGSGDESGNAVAVDPLGNAYVTGWTESADYPTANALRNNSGGGRDAFAAKISVDLVSLSAASFGAVELSAESIVAAFGSNLAATTQTASSVPLPTTLAGTRVEVRDSVGVIRAAPLFFVSPNQVNYLLPPGLANGAATVSVTSGNGNLALGTVQIATVAPGLFTANATGQGVPAAVALRVRGDGSQSFEPVAQLDASANRFVPILIDLGASTDQIVLLLFGTGLRGRSNLAAVTCGIGGVQTPISFAGAQGDLVGLDQINVGPLPRTLAGRGEVDVALTVDGKLANTVRVSIK